MSHNTFHPEDKSPHVGVGTCGKCRKKFERGHRVTMAHIFDTESLNPMDLGHRGIMLYDEFELVHINCNDPFLKKGLKV